MEHWHVATGLKGYGPDGSVGFAYAETTEELCGAITYEIDRAIEHQSQEGSYHAEKAREFRESGDILSELAHLRDFLVCNSLVEELEVNHGNFCWSRSETPLYRGKPELFEEAILKQVSEQFPMNTGHYNRLYVWKCTEGSSCEHLSDD
jgi:hypothetical protein